MLKTVITLIALLTVLFSSGCAISPAYPPYGPGAYVTSPAPYYYAPAPYYSSWGYSRGYGYGHRRWR